MKSTFASIGALALIIWLGLVAGAANASTTTIDNWSGSASAGYSADFGQNQLFPSGVFFSDYSFSLPAGSSGNGEVNITSTDISIEAFTLYDPSNQIIVGGPIFLSTTSASLSFSGLAAPVIYTLHILGLNADMRHFGSYTGSVVISPVISSVPEPKTYAMMLLGLGLMGFAARRRMNTPSSGLTS